METTTASLEQIFNTKQKKLAFFQNVVLIAIADHNLDKMEGDFLVTLGNQLGLTEADTLTISDNLTTLDFIIPEESVQKSKELELLVKMVLQDGEVEEREYNLCLEYTRKIGFDQVVLDDLIKQRR